MTLCDIFFPIRRKWVKLSLTNGVLKINIGAELQQNSEGGMIIVYPIYHFWYILDEEVSDDMWLDIAGMVGLEHVSSVDIDLIPKCQNGNQYLEHKN